MLANGKVSYFHNESLMSMGFKINPLFVKQKTENKTDYYLFGFKIFSKTENTKDEKIFLVFNTAGFGDVLLCNSLCQNIKLAFSKSKIVFIVDKNWEDIAKFQKDVDEVVVLDKKGVHKGFWGLLKFVKEFKHKKPFASFVTYKNERNILIANLLRSKFVITPNKNNAELYVPYRHSKLLEKLINKKAKNLPIKYILPNGVKNPLENEKYIVLCFITKNPPKDMPICMAKDLIENINSKTQYKPVLVGIGALCEEYAKQLKKSGADFINLVNKTTLLELGALLKGSVGLISCDTGTMHFSYSMKVKTLCLFFEKGTAKMWAPKEDLYPNVKVLKDEFSSDDIYASFEYLRASNE